VVVLQFAAACERLTARREQLRSSVSRLVGYASNLANSCLSVALPALLAAVIVRKKTGDCPIGVRSPGSIIRGRISSECPLFFATFLTRVRHSNLPLSGGDAI
jgi:hypothetical protein